LSGAGGFHAFNLLRDIQKSIQFLKKFGMNLKKFKGSVRPSLTSGPAVSALDKLKIT
jgi:hypothetical protein